MIVTKELYGVEIQGEKISSELK